MDSLLALREVTHIFGVSHLAYAVDNVSFGIPETPTILNLVGESGSGKSTLARIILRLQKPTSGQVLYKGQDVFGGNQDWGRQFRREVQGVFQNPYSVYNPFYKVERVFSMAIRKLGLPISRAEAQERVADALRAVDLRPGDVLGKYPHQLSGGMRQRVMMARIHLIRPRLVIADEPVSMVDAGIRASFLNILMDFRDHYGISTLFITHDLSTAEYLGGEIIVLYKGRIVERGATAAVTASPRHPYAQLLMKSIPIADPTQRWQEELKTTPETENKHVVSRDRCLYAERCPFVMEQCWQSQPPTTVAFETEQPEREMACYLYAEKE